MHQEPLANLDFGVSIHDLDCADVDQDLAFQLRTLVAENQVIVFRGQQHLNPNQEVAFYQTVNPDCHSIWRDQENNPWEKYKVEQGNEAGTYQIPGAPGVLVLGKGDINHHGLQVTLGGSRSAYGSDRGSQVLGGGDLQWHIDGTFYECHPCRMTQMRCVEAPVGEGHWVNYNDGSGDRIWCAAGATAFASGRTAFDLLSIGDRRACVNTRVRYASKPFQASMNLANNDNGLRVVNDTGDGVENKIGSSPVDDPVAKIYPIVWTCQETGKHALMPHPRCLHSLEVDAGDNTEILSLEESRARVEALMRPAISPHRVYVHNWAPGDLVLWNNHSIWHSATGKLSADDRRVMHLTAYNASTPPTFGAKS